MNPNINRKYSANYTFTNHNFIIQNCKPNYVEDNEYYPAFCIAKNLLQRGVPTLMTQFLQDKLKISLHKESNWGERLPLISHKKNVWQDKIKGSSDSTYNPAKVFYDEKLYNFLKKNKLEYIYNLVLPEAFINEITNKYNEDFKNQQVDFFIPQAFLVIEIDGIQHNKSKVSDEQRDEYLKSNGLDVIRIPSKDINNDEKLNKYFNQILQRIDIINNKKDGRGKFQRLTLNKYQEYYNKKVDPNDIHYVATAIMRFQILILELLQSGIISLDDKVWDIELIERDTTNFADYAIDDTFDILDRIFQLQKIDYNKPEIQIKKVDNFSKKKNIKIDFSIFERWNDEPILYPHIIYCRTDYFDEYIEKKEDVNKGGSYNVVKPYDYFKMCTTKPYKYKLNVRQSGKDYKALRQFLWDLFLQNDETLTYQNVDFREGQVEIIANALSGRNTIGLLPTGSGKSVCYQLAALLQPAISFVVCPIKALMVDQRDDLHRAYITHVNSASSNDSAKEKNQILNDFSKGKYFFIFISPERFQIESFRNYFQAMMQNFNLAYAVIDEAHCLSEWGHDFRISYLNLASTITQYNNDFKFIALTATASLNVLNDLQIELGIKDDDVITPSVYTRDELEFIVKDSSDDKFSTLVSLLNELDNSLDIFSLQGNDTRCGLIFTPNVNGDYGCYDLSVKLNNLYKDRLSLNGTTIGCFAGSTPKTFSSQNYTFDTYKEKIQAYYKANKVSIITATKAFGMGINKGNIYFTCHYGIPMSLEALYQEAGRAGRSKEKFKKEKAKCFVLFSAETNENALDILWNDDVTVSEIKDLVSYKSKVQLTADISKLAFLFSSNLEDVEDEVENIYDLYEKNLSDNCGQKTFRRNQTTTEKYLYKLKQVGIVKDWTVDFSAGNVTVHYTQCSPTQMETNVLSVIHKYQKEFELSEYDCPYYEDDIKKYLWILLRWSYDHFTYYRKESLMTVYEICLQALNGEIDAQELKEKMEAYFRFDKKTHKVQKIIQNLDDYQEWFDVFYNDTGTELLKKSDLSELQMNLRRFVESYKDSTALDLISGLTNILLGKSDKTSGKGRFEKALAKVAKSDMTKKNSIFSNILKIVKNYEDIDKHNISESLCKYFNTHEELVQINNAFDDDNSAKIILTDFHKRLIGVKDKVGV